MFHSAAKKKKNISSFKLFVSLSSFDVKGMREELHLGTEATIQQ